jgi:outer membrane biosynthesis protein TonB
MFGRRIEFELIAPWILWGSLLGHGGSKSPSQAQQPAPQHEAASSDASSTTTSPTRTYADSVGTGNRIEILPETQDASSDAYVQHLLTQLKKSWLAFIPDEARNGAPAKVTAVFEILSDGKLPKGDPQIESGSGLASLDKAAIYAIRYWHRYDPLPTDFHAPSLKLRINFLYNVQTTTPIEIASTATPQPTQAPTGPVPSAADNYGFQILSDTQGVDFNPYIARMLALLKKNWIAIMPEKARMGTRGASFVVFSIGQDGSLSPGLPTLERSSGDADLDKAAMDTIGSSQFEALPGQFHGPFLKLRILFLYNIRPSPELFKTPVGKDQ